MELGLRDLVLHNHCCRFWLNLAPNHEVLAIDRRDAYQCNHTVKRSNFDQIQEW